MKSLLPALAACLCLLLATCPAKAQTKPQPLAVAPLRPRIVRIDPGTLVQRQLIGFDVATYEQLRADRAADSLLLGLRTLRIANLYAQRRSDSLSLLAYGGEIRRLREERAHAYAMLSRQELAFEKLASRPLEKPFLLNPNTYRGALGGVLLTLAGLVFIHR